MGGWYQADDGTWFESVSPPADGWWLASDQRWYPPSVPPASSASVVPAHRTVSGSSGGPRVGAALVAGLVMLAVLLLGVVVAAAAIGGRSTHPNAASSTKEVQRPTTTIVSKRPTSTTTTETPSTSTTTTSTTTSTTVPPPPAPEPPVAAVGQDRDHQNPELTPGAVFDGVDAGQVCVVGYSSSVRNVSTDLRQQVFAEYGIPWSEHSGYEVDHLISLELGGSNDIRNLWPEPYDGGDSARDKDGIENRLHRQVCNGEISLDEAQAKIRDWDGTRPVLPDPVRTPFTGTPPASAPSPAPAPPPVAPGAPGAATSFPNCAAARAAGAAPLHVGDPGYRPGLDGDHDGTACE